MAILALLSSSGAAELSDLVNMESIPDHERKRLQMIADDDASLEDLVRRRLAGEPLQYLEGTSVFAGLELRVDERVLIPRPETETLFDLATKMVRQPETIVDLCTGSGALALALKKEFPGSAVFATDISAEAIDLANENRLRNRLAVYLAQGDLYDPLPASLLGSVDLIVANPPYVAEVDYQALPLDVQKEPRIALVAGPSGLEVIQRIGADAAQWLRPGGVIICEIGEKQGISASSSFLDLPAVVRKDLNGRDRYIVAVKP